MNINAHHTSRPWVVLVFALLAFALTSPRSAAQSALATPPVSAASSLNMLTARADSPLPAGTRLLSLRTANGLATADFSRELVDNFQGGDSQEVAAVNSILRVLGRYPEINRVQILVEGRPVDSLGGLIVVSDPLRVLRPDEDNSGHPRRVFLHRKVVPNRAKPAPHARQSLS